MQNILTMNDNEFGVCKEGEIWKHVGWKRERIANFGIATVRVVQNQYGKIQYCFRGWNVEVFQTYTAAQQSVHPTCGDSRPLQSLSTPEADTPAEVLSTPPTSG
jgi:hypothetical protein